MVFGSTRVAQHPGQHEPTVACPGKVAGWRALSAACCFVAVAGHAGAYPSRPPIFDWGVRWIDPNTPASIIPVPHPGSDGPAGSFYYTNQVYPSLVAAGHPLSLMLNDSTAPQCGTGSPGALETVMGYLGPSTPLKYVFADIEYTPCSVEDVFRMVELVRQNPVHHAARCGAYQWFPGPIDVSRPYPLNLDRTGQHELYMQSGLDVAMPDAYTYASYSVHTESIYWGDRVAPNIRAAIFWGPLEHFSLAKRNLPAGHQLIPWLSGYMPWEDYPYEAPPVKDMKALIKHIRLRGAQGYFTLVSGLDALPPWWSGDPPPSYYYYTNAQYRRDVLISWKSLDRVFNQSARPKILNLKTDKTLGVQASGVLFGSSWNKVLIFISNLRDDTAVRVYLPAIEGLPPYVDVPCSQAAGGAEHFQRTYRVPPVNLNQIPPWHSRRPGDVNGDWRVNQQDVEDVLAAWGDCPAPRCQNACPADLNFDGVVDDLDYALVIDNLN